MLDIFQIHWYFGSARCKKHEQQKQYVPLALLQTPYIKYYAEMEDLGGGFLQYQLTTHWFVFSIAELSAKL